MKLGDLELNVIHTGDARVLSEGIPDGSIDLIFTDPIYDREGDYLWLAETAKRVLKPSGAVLCWSNGKWHRTNANWLEAAGLVYRWDFGCVIHADNAPMCGKVISKTNRLLWFDLNGRSKMKSSLADGYLSMSWTWKGAKQFKWTKDPRFTAQALKAFSDEAATAFDPFCGGATVPAICKMLCRNFLAFEIEPDTAKQARQRLNQTMPLLEAQLQEQLFEGAAA